MAGGDGTALVLVTHDGVDQREVEDVLRRRWPDVVVKALEQEQPAVTMLANDAACLGRCRRGVEPLRIVIMPQQDHQTIISPIIIQCARRHYDHPDRADHLSRVAGQGGRTDPTCSQIPLTDRR
jgi:hypothetical protein